MGGGKVNLWELTPEYRKQRCDEMLQEMSELRMENGKLKANLSGKEKKIQRLEAFEKAVEKSKKRKYRSAKKMLDDTMELWDTHGVILSLLTKGDKSTSQILNSKRIQFSRVTLLKRLRELEAKGMVKSNEHWGKDRRGRMLVWTITEHDVQSYEVRSLGGFETRAISVAWITRWPSKPAPRVRILYRPPQIP